MSKKDTTSF